MPRSGDGHSSGDVIRTDVCVIGGGPAGIVVATEASATGKSVVVIEAGPEAYDQHALRNLPRILLSHASGAQAGARGTNGGRPYYPLRMSRVRGVGGSTRALKAHGLRSRPLDPIDFEPRFGVEWPLPYDEFAAFLPEAARYCGFAEPRDGWAAYPVPLGRLESRDLRAVEFVHGPRDRFRNIGAASLEGNKALWLTSCVATDLHLDAAGYVTRISTSSATGDSPTIEARHVVLAVGGIDNARILLANPSALHHMGRSSDNVGRFFMEHLHYVCGHLIPPDESTRGRVEELFAEAAGRETWLAPEDSVVQSHDLARTAYAAIPAHSESLQSSVGALGRLLRIVPYGPFDRRFLGEQLGMVARGSATLPGALLRRTLPTSTRNVFAVTAMGEQTPNPDSRVTLGDRTDRHGLRLPRLEWRLTDRDIASVRRSGEILGRALEAAGLGEFLPTWSGPQGHLPTFTGGWHHMGTTRMSADAAHGVVDLHGRVHGVANLHIAGSSVFPTGGFANPTLSLVALAVRLGRRLAASTD